MEEHLQPFLLRSLHNVVRGVVRGPVLLVSHLLHDGHGPRQRFAAIRMHFPLNRVLDRKNMLAFSAAYLKILAGTTRIGPVMEYLVGSTAALAGYDPCPILLVDLAQGRDGQAALLSFTQGHGYSPLEVCTNNI